MVSKYVSQNTFGSRTVNGSGLFLFGYNFYSVRQVGISRAFY